MNCKFVSQKICSYIDGELPGAEMLAIRAHLHDCSECALEAEALCSLKFELANMPCTQPPAEFEERLLRVVRLEAGPTLSRRQLGFRWGSAVLAASAAGFAFVWFGVLGASGAEGGFAVDRSQPAGTFEVSQDQAYQSGADPLGGHGLVVTTSYGQ